MKKFFKTCLLLILCLTFLAACSKKVTVDDLKANKWTVENKEEGVPDVIASFSDSLMTVTIDSSSIDATTTEEWGDLGEEFAKGLMDQMKFKLVYTLDKDQITLKDTDDKEDNQETYTVSRDDDNIIFTPNDTSDEDAETITLKPRTTQEDSSK